MLGCELCGEFFFRPFFRHERLHVGAIFRWELPARFHHPAHRITLLDVADFSASGFCRVVGSKYFEVGSLKSRLSASPISSHGRGFFTCSPMNYYCPKLFNVSHFTSGLQLRSSDSARKIFPKLFLVTRENVAKCKSKHRRYAWTLPRG